MTRADALSLLREYQEYVAESAGPYVLKTIRDRFPKYGSEAKAMRWLGFAQGVLHANNVFDLEDLKQHSKNGTIH